MIAGALPLGLGYLALFSPPGWVLADSTLLAAWLLACSLWIRTAITLFGLPHLALAAEMTQDYHERSHLLGMRSGFVYFFVLRSVSSSSIVADLTDEHESTSGKRQEGSFYSVLSFAAKLATAAGPLYSAPCTLLFCPCQ